MKLDMKKPFNIYLFKRKIDSKIVCCTVTQSFNDWMEIPVFLKKDEYEIVSSVNIYGFYGILKAFELAIKYNLTPITKNKNILLFIY